MPYTYEQEQVLIVMEKEFDEQRELDMNGEFELMMDMYEHNLLQSEDL